MKANRPALLIVAAFAVLAAATLVPLWSAPGWPSNHNGPIFAQHTLIYARHFSWLDLLPIWSSADNAGFGSPMPAMYHKLFYPPAALVALATGSFKDADAAGIFLFLVIGAVGMYLTMRDLGASRFASTVAGCCLITANYTVTDWMVRGAVAELSAAMIVPWVLRAFIGSIRAGELTIGLGVAVALLWLGHSVLAYFTVILLGTTYVVLAIEGLAPWSLLRPQTAWRSVVCFTVIVAPFLLPMAVLSRAYDVHRVVSPPYQPIYQFRPPLAYVWQQHYSFGRTASGFTVEIDHAVVAMLIAGLCALGLRSRQAGGAPWRPALLPVAAFLVVAALALLLQLEIADSFYEWVPGAVYIQFPWRLLAIMTPALIVAALFLADNALHGHVRTFALGAVAVWMILACGAFVPMQDPRIPIEPTLAGVSFEGFGENEPRDAAPIADIRTALAARWHDAGCTYDNLNPSNEEVPVARFHVSCARSTTLPLPLYASRLHRVTTRDAKRQPCLSLDDFRGVCSAVVPAGESEIDVHLPNMAALVEAAWRYGRLRNLT